MARDISKIRQQTLQREKKKILTPKIYVKQPKTVGLLRAKEIREDSGTQIVLDKLATSKKLSKVIVKKRKELDAVIVSTKALLRDSTKEVDRIVSEARQKAVGITSEAQTAKSLATRLVNQARTKKKELKALKLKIVKREKDVKEKEDNVNTGQQLVKNKQIRVDRLLKSASKSQKGAVEIFVISVALYQLIFDQLDSLQNLTSDFPEDASQTLANAGRMMERTAVLIKNIDIDKSILSKEAIGLQAREKRVIDREKMLLRSSQEVGRNLKKNGRR